jgi:hypothetical protein
VPSTAPTALECRWLSYALAAGATLACTAPSHAEVVFTPSNATLLGTSGQLAIDLDNDGTADFTLIIKNVRSFSGYSLVPGLGVYGNKRSAQIGASPFGGFARALPKGFQIAGGQHFQASASMESWWGQKGSWGNVVHRFLGLRFLIDGKVHYGWIGFRKVNDNFVDFGAYLGGWAYESDPDTPIGAGNTEGAAQSTASVHPSSLEVLAKGHKGIEQRRQRTEGN